MTPDHPSPACQAGRASLVANRDAVLFTPNEGTFTLSGKITRAGAIAADNTLLGADKKPFTSALHGQAAVNAITGTYTTPRCRYTITLTRS